MRYRELKAVLATFSEEELDQDVTVMVSDGEDSEFYPLLQEEPVRTTTDECDVLDPGHKVLVI